MKNYSKRLEKLKSIISMIALGTIIGIFTYAVGYYLAALMYALLREYMWAMAVITAVLLAAHELTKTIDWIERKKMMKRINKRKYVATVFVD